MRQVELSERRLAGKEEMLLIKQSSKGMYKSTLKRREQTLPSKHSP